MMNWKRWVAAFLCIVCFISAMPMNVFAAEETELITESDESCDLVQAEAPTDLKWHAWRSDLNGEVHEIDTPGAMSWYCNEKSDILLEVYRVGEESPVYSAIHSGTGWMTAFLPGVVEDLTSGRYYFCVTARGDGEEYQDSESIQSSIFTYVWFVYYTGFRHLR